MSRSCKLELSLRTRTRRLKTGTLKLERLALKPETLLCQRGHRNIPFRHGSLNLVTPAVRIGEQPVLNSLHGVKKLLEVRADLILFADLDHL